jgi:hypothetical protein
MKKKWEPKAIGRPRLSVAEYRKKHADLLQDLFWCGNNADVARRFGISSARVSQIVKRAGMRRVVVLL